MGMSVSLGNSNYMIASNGSESPDAVIDGGGGIFE